MKRAEPGVTARRAELAAAWAAQLADGPVSQSRQSEFEAWLGEEPANGETLEEVTGAWRAVEHYAAAEPMMALREEALAFARRTAETRREGETRARRAISPWLSWPTAATAAAAMLMAGAVGWGFSQPTGYSTGVGERRVVALSDGSHLSLDADSQVQVKYTGKERRLWLKRGRAQFEVAKNPLRPFSVRAAGDVVVATGTEFSVELLKAQVRVVLYEGRVALLKDTAAGPRPILFRQNGPAERLLTPGKEVILAAEPSASEPPGFVPAAVAGHPAAPPPEAVTVVAAADAVRSRAWENGQLAFENETLGVVAERMNRYTATPLLLANATTANARISGVFRAGDTDALIEGLSAGFDIRSRRSANGITLYKAPA